MESIEIPEIAAFNTSQLWRKDEINMIKAKFTLNWYLIELFLFDFVISTQCLKERIFFSSFCFETFQYFFLLNSYIILWFTSEIADKRYKF